MNIVLTASAPGLDEASDPRFGRCAYFLLVDLDGEQFTAYPNAAVNASGGAGTRAAQFVAGLRPAAVVSGDFGPNALSALAAAGIRLYRYGDCVTVRDALARFKAGQLEPVGAAA